MRIVSLSCLIHNGIQGGFGSAQVNLMVMKLRVTNAVELEAT